MNELSALIDAFSRLAICIHSYERALAELPCFRGVDSPFRSPVLQLSHSEIRFARLFAGDCVRLLVGGANARVAKFNAKSLHFVGVVTPMESEKEAIVRLKMKLRDCLYKVIDLSSYIVESSDCSLNEFHLYRFQLLAHLKRCDQALGLRLGEI